MAANRGPGPSTRRMAQSRLEEGVSLARGGDRAAARAVFREIIHASPYDEDAWLWLAWVADTQDLGLSYLREAQTLLPNSTRIAEAIRWATEEPARVAKAGHSGRTAVRGLTFDARRLAAEASRAARSAQASATRAFEQLKGRMPGISLPNLEMGRIPAVVVPILSSLAIATMIAFVVLGIIYNLRRESQVSQALTLPTPIPNSTPTLTAAQRSRPLWVQMDVAWTREDWDGVIASLERIRQIDPYDAEARTRLAEARYCRALEMMRDEKPGETNLLEAARLELDQAVRLDASIQGLPEARSQLRMYLDGLDAYWLQDWPQALEYLQLVYDLNPDFRDTRVMLGQAYYEVAVELQQEEVWEDARDAFQQAVHLMPDFPEAQSRLALVLDAITPPRRIEIDLSDQTLTVMDNHQAVQRWTVCTGRANTPTLPGRYEVQTKLPQAYASKWDIFMPLWLGIYWAGGSENGIHALPLTRSGTVLWRERLGRPCSYGCIVVATEAQEWLYNWAEVGTVVFIRR